MAFFFFCSYGLCSMTVTSMRRNNEEPGASRGEGEAAFASVKLGEYLERRDRGK